MDFPINKGASSPPIHWDYDVFLSFRGEDTRYGFTSHLYKALCVKGSNTFIDNDIQRGEVISKELLTAIERSKNSIIVFSENYSSSGWCLDELVKILECRQNGQVVIPVFYKVDPSEVRNQKGNFGKMFAKLEEKFKNDTEKVQKWKVALNEVANLSGWPYQDGNPESEFIEKIVEGVSPANLKGPSFVARYPVGLNSRMEAIESLLDFNSKEVVTVGIYGLGGVGKTTLAKAVYNSIVNRFEGSCFLDNVKENSSTYDGRISLQEKLLSQILGRNFKVDNISIGINVIKEKLQYKKILVILDDVDKLSQIEDLLGKIDWLAPGSRVILTARDKHLLTLVDRGPSICKVEELNQDELLKLYEVKVLNQREALELFSKCAFQKSIPETDYLQLANQFVGYASGLPLALQVIGFDLRGRSISQWEAALEMYKNIPHNGILEILKISYNQLEKSEQDIFLDIACFLNGFPKNYAIDILDACNLYATLGIEKLIDKCLVTVDRFDKLSMHDLLQQMGWHIAQQEGQLLENRSRQCCHEEVLEVLNENKGSENTKGIRLCVPEPITIQLEAKAFKKMKNLRFLIVDNVQTFEGLKYLPNGLRLLNWPDYAFPLPSSFCPKNLVHLNMPRSKVILQELLNQTFKFENLKYIQCESCEAIVNFSALNTPNLVHLDLSKCKNLVEVHESVGFLDKLEYLQLNGCEKLQILPSSLRLKSLRYFDLRDCSRLVKFPNILPGMESLQILLMSGTCIRELPSSIGYLTGLEKLDVSNCQNLMDLPDSIYKLRHLNTLEISSCNKLKIGRRLSSDSVGSFSEYGFLKLKYLNLKNCKNLIELDFFMMPNYLLELEYLCLEGTGIVMIPKSISKFARLRRLGIKDCMQLREIPKLPRCIRIVCAMNCLSLDPQSLRRLLSQAGEILGISSNRVCQGARSDILIDPQSSNGLSHHSILSPSLLFDDFAIEIESFGFEDEDIYYEIILPGTEIPKWFNHQSVGNSISFWVGPKFPELAICIAFGPEALKGEFVCQVYLSINGYKKRINVLTRKEESCDHLWLFSKSHWKFQKQLNDSNPSEQNCVEVLCNLYSSDLEESRPVSIKRCGVHVECTCHS